MNRRKRIPSWLAIGAAGMASPPESDYMGTGELSLSRRPDRMQTIFQSLTPIAMAAVAIVLVLGLVNMMRGGSPNRSQKLMRMRVLLQFVAVVIMMTSLYFASR